MSNREKNSNGRTRKQQKKTKWEAALPWGRPTKGKSKVHSKRPRNLLHDVQNTFEAKNRDGILEETLKTQPNKPHGKILLLECRGGTDKGANGHRRDTVPICNALIDMGWCSYPIFYNDEEAAQVEIDLLAADGVIVRVNPAVYEGVTQSLLDEMLARLAEKGVCTMSHPETMKKMGSKMAIVKVNDLPFGMKDTFAYRDFHAWSTNFKETIATGPRVIKQNRGSQGEGIWVCNIKGVAFDGLPDEGTMLELQEAKDNHKEEMSLGDFTQFCRQYLEGEDGLIVDQRFLPRIVEGEIRVNMIYDQAIEIVHKKCVEGGISSTLASGANYVRYSPSDLRFAPLVALLNNNLWKIMPALDLADVPLPLIWSVDFILGPKNADGTDSFFIGEINCSCVGITKQLHLCSEVAKAAISIVQQHRNALVNRAVTTFIEGTTQDRTCSSSSWDGTLVHVDSVQAFTDSMTEVPCQVMS
mmetsp:Transcript_10563/g.64944  ORF Transcript_10563/g.64944 Transcript_10563/m.64944 type:complete len:471 (-) Transcript_10563:870-2282(-)